MIKNAFIIAMEDLHTYYLKNFLKYKYLADQNVMIVFIKDFSVKTEVKEIIPSFKINKSIFCVILENSYLFNIIKRDRIFDSNIKLGN